MEGWQTCSLLLTINVDSTLGEQQHSRHPLFINTFTFNISSVITWHWKPHQSFLNILHEPRALVPACYWYAILPKLKCYPDLHTSISYEIFCHYRRRRIMRQGRERGVLCWGRRRDKEGERKRGENRGGKKQRGKGSFLSYWYPVVPLLFL